MNNNNFEEISNMLYESIKATYKVVKKPKMNNENKMLIASVNTLANTTKIAIQNEILRNRLNNSNGTLNKLIDKIGE